jgi:hypothetical protein
MAASNFNELLIKMAMDTSQAAKDLEAFAKKAQVTTSTAATDKASIESATKKEALEKATTAHAQKNQQLAEASKKTWADVGGAYAVINGGLEKANRLIGFMVSSADAYAKTMNAVAGASTFGASAADLEKMNAALLGTVSNLDLARAAQQGLSVGLQGQELQDATKAAGILAQQLGLGKDEALKMMMSGKMSAQALQVAGLQQEEIANAILEAETKRGAALTEQEKAYLSIQMITKAMSEQKGGLDRQIGQATDELARARKEFAEITEHLGKVFLPILTTTLKIVVVRRKHCRCFLPRSHEDVTGERTSQNAAGARREGCGFSQDDDPGESAGSIGRTDPSRTATDRRPHRRGEYSTGSDPYDPGESECGSEGSKASGPKGMERSATKLPGRST